MRDVSSSCPALPLSRARCCVLASILRLAFATFGPASVTPEATAYAQSPVPDTAAELDRALAITSPMGLFDVPAVGESGSASGASRAEQLQDVTGRYDAYGGPVVARPSYIPPGDSLYSVGIEAAMSRDCSSIDFKSYISGYLKDKLDELAAYYSVFTDPEALLGLMAALGLAYLEPTIEQVLSEFRVQAMGRLNTRMDQCQIVKQLRDSGFGESMVGVARDLCVARALEDDESADIVSSVCSGADQIGSVLGEVAGTTTSFFDAVNRVYKLSDEVRWTLVGDHPTEEQSASGALWSALIGNVELRIGDPKPPPGSPPPPPGSTPAAPPGLVVEPPALSPRDLYDASHTRAFTACLAWRDRVRAGDLPSPTELDRYLEDTSTPDWMMTPDRMAALAADATHYDTFGCERWSDTVARDRVRSIGEWLVRQTDAALRVNTKLDTTTRTALVDRAKDWKEAARHLTDADRPLGADLAVYFATRTAEATRAGTLGAAADHASGNVDPRLLDPLGVELGRVSP